MGKETPIFRHIFFDQAGRPPASTKQTHHETVWCFWVWRRVEEVMCVLLSVLKLYTPHPQPLCEVLLWARRETLRSSTSNIHSTETPKP